MPGMHLSEEQPGGLLTWKKNAWDWAVQEDMHAFSVLLLIDASFRFILLVDTFLDHYCLLESYTHFIYTWYPLLSASKFKVQLDGQEYGVFESVLRVPPVGLAESGGELDSLVLSQHVAYIPYKRYKIFHFKFQVKSICYLLTMGSLK